MPLDDFETLLAMHRPSVERYVKFRLPSAADADDVLQEIYLAAFLGFPALKSPDIFHAWLIGIARNKCADYFRRQAKQKELPLDSVPEAELSVGRCGLTFVENVRETVQQLKSHDQQILYLYFWRELPQAEIAKLLHIPLGTVKSRLHTAKQNFKEHYPEKRRKGEPIMKELPEILPAYTIEPTDALPFPVKWEELMGWFLVPKPGERINWAMYDQPSGKRMEYCKMQVLGKAEVHGIEGVELQSLEYCPVECNAIEGQNPVERRFVAQLTDTHCRYLAESQIENGIRKFRTFLDGGAFLNNWGFGENNCGNETNLQPKGDICRDGIHITAKAKPFLLDMVGRFTVTIGGKRYDTVCVMDIETYNEGVVSEQFLDQNGRTVLWRRFNRDDWAIDRYQKRWSELLPANDRLIVNGETYVHWYDCITDYIL